MTAIPHYQSAITGSETLRAQFEDGAKALGLGTARKPILEHQYRMADTLNALNPETGLALNRVTVLHAPRRSAKTTSALAVAIGRLFDPELEDYQVALTGQTGVKARDRFLTDVAKPLERLYPDPDTRPFTINRAAGSTHIRWPDGSRLSVLPPNPESFRGDAFDMILIDEAQTIDPEESEDLEAAILPTMLTRPGAQLVLLLTAGDHRSGLAWKYLELGRAGMSGLLDYSAPDDTRLHFDGMPEDQIPGSTADPEVG
jgi:hypothetical protein